MEIALQEAVKAEKEGEVPVGAVLVKDGRLIASAHNRNIFLSDPTAHAEILALREGARRLGNYRLEGAVLYVTKEPCLMCLGAMIHARIKKLVFGAEDPKSGAFSAFSVDLSRANHMIEVVSGIMAEESANILKKFFRARR